MWRNDCKCIDWQDDASAESSMGIGASHITKGGRRHSCCLPFVLLEVLEQVIHNILHDLFQALLHDGGDLRHQPVLLFLFALFALIIAAAHFFFTST